MSTQKHTRAKEFGLGRRLDDIMARDTVGGRMGERAVRMLLPSSSADMIQNAHDSHERASAEIDPWDNAIDTFVMTVSPGGVFSAARLLSDNRLKAPLVNNDGRVVAFYTKGNMRMKQIADDFSDHVENIGIHFELRELPYEVDTRKYAESYTDVAVKYPNAILDTTGGRGTMSSAAESVFVAAGRPVIHLAPDSSEIEHIFGTRGIDVTHPDNLDSHPAIIDMLKLDGLTVKIRAGERQCSDAGLNKISALREHDIDAFVELQSSINETNGQNGKGAGKARLPVEGFSDDEFRLDPTATGGWLPEYLEMQLKKLTRQGVTEVFREVQVHSKGTHRPGRSEAETAPDIDVAGIYRGTPFLIEAKAVSERNMVRELTKSLDHIIQRRHLGDQWPGNAVVFSLEVPDRPSLYLKNLLQDAADTGVWVGSMTDFNNESIKSTLEEIVANSKRYHSATRALARD